VTTAHADRAIDLDHVVKTYRGKVHALRGISMHVDRGAVFGLLGPNGAGKSTLVKIMLTIIRPTRAEGRVLGQPVGHKPTLGRIGFLPEHHRMPLFLTGRQAVDHFGALAGVDRATRKKRIPGLLELVGMHDAADRKIGGYSKGMMQRIGLAQALVNDPELVILDEPTDGVDPVGRRDIRDLLARLREEGRTVFINSHILSELEMICDRVAILIGGEVRSSGTIEELTEGSRRYEIEVRGEAPAWCTADPELDCVRDGELSRITRIGEDADPIQPLIDRLRQEAVTILSVRPRRESLEDLFVRTVGDGIEATPGAATARGPAHPPSPPPSAPASGDAAATPPATPKGGDA
jgi:ABC-2 type transport system ATP-binding protein